MIMQAYLTKNVIDQTSSSIFYKDKLIFCFLLAYRLTSSEREDEDDEAQEMHFFISGRQNKQGLAGLYEDEGEE